jgi:hypothetical protein
LSAEKEEYILSRQLYKEFKSMNRDRMQEVLKNIYNQGVESAGVASVDLNELRTAIGKINGIGEKRLDEIMNVIEQFVEGK